MYRGNVHKVMEDVDRILDRLHNTKITICGLAKEYHVGYGTLRQVLLKRISKEQYDAISRAKRSKSNSCTQFKKGQSPWNKGLKGTHFSRATEFKKGHVPTGYRRIGEIYIVSETNGKPCRYIKLKDTGRPQDRRVPYARYVWERAHGPIPPGYLVIHDDGDTMNDDPSNLLLVNRAQNAAHQLATNPTHLTNLRQGGSEAAKRRHARTRILKLRGHLKI